MSKLLALINPYMWVVYLALTASVIGGGFYVKHKYDEGKREEGRAEVRKVLQPKLDAEILKTKSLSSLIEVQNNHIANLGIETEAAQKRAIAAIKKAEPIARAAKEKKLRLDGVGVRLNGNKATCQDDLADINRLLGVK